ncbi:MAG: hypothetical protein AB7T09_16020 [Planctomycetota bacterium]
MSTYACDARPDAAARGAPRLLAETLMLGRWATHAYQRSCDGKTLFFQLEQGVRVQRGAERVDWKLDFGREPRELRCAPDSRRAAFWARAEEGQASARIAIADLSSLTPTPRVQALYEPAAGHHPFGMEWSPDGEALFVVELVEARRGAQEVRESALTRVEVPSGRTREVFRHPGPIDFFMPPVPRLGGGPGRDPSLLVGCEGGLFLVDPRDGARRRVPALPSTGLYDIEWSPDPRRDLVALYFRFPAPGPDGRRATGVYLLDLDRLRAAGDRAGVDPTAFAEQLYEGRDVHTLWFSPRGTWITWATPEKVYLRRVGDPAARAQEPALELELPGPDGAPARLKGVAWNDAETRLAITAENELWVYDLAPAARPKGARPTPEEERVAALTGKLPHRYRIAAFPAGFAADPHWDGERVLVSLFERVKGQDCPGRLRPPLPLPPAPKPQEPKPQEPKKPEQPERPEQPRRR